MSHDLVAPLAFANGVVAPNRVWLAPMTNLQSEPDGTLGENELRWLARRADGGFGVIETCAAYVAQDGKAWPGQLGIHDDATLPGLTRLAARIEGAGARGLVQLFHGGVRASSKVSGVAPWSASTWQESGASFEVPRAATEEDLARVISSFKDAALRAERAGFSGVELHAAHGYLFSQFLSATMNTRSDRWGGSIEARARLLREVLAAVRAAVGPRFVVGVRISPEDFGFARGLDLDESLRVSELLVADGIDFLHLSLWDAAQRTKKRPEAHPIPLFRALVPARVPIVAAGAVWTLEEARALRALGADAIAIGRAAIGNPDWPSRVGDPTFAPERPPYTRARLAALDVSDIFATYLTRWKGFVAEAGSGP